MSDDLRARALLDELFRPSKPGQLTIRRRVEKTPDVEQSAETPTERTQRIFPHRCMGVLGYDCAICRWVREKWSGR